MKLLDSVTVLRNIGEKRLLMLKRLRIFTIYDLICHFPRTYQDRSKMTTASQVEIGVVNTVVAKISEKAENISVSGRMATRLVLYDQGKTLDIIWYNQPYLAFVFKKGNEYAFTGRVLMRQGKAHIYAPEYEKFSDDELLSLGRIIPVYGATAGLSQKLLRSIVKQAIDEIKEQFTEFLPCEILSKNGLISRHEAIFNIHFPKSDEHFFNARKRLVFEELFIMQLALFKVKGYIKCPSPFVYKDNDCSRFLQLLPFSMTNAQQAVLGEILEDLESGMVMNRLIQGDVGSGKTAVAMVCAYVSTKNGGQVAIMAPTEVLATQHFASFKEIFEQVGVSVCLLCGSLKAAEKRKTKELIKNGEMQIIIGTHALIQHRLEFANLQLVVTDEQHRFGVRQRLSLSEKGDMPHVIAMTATPIPRTLALVIYGDMDVSIINEMPPGRQKIDTYSVGESYQKRIFAFIEKEVNNGRQAYIVCPMIEEKNEDQEEDLDETVPKKPTKKALNAVLTYVEKAREQMPGLKIECLHGRMSPEKKVEIMNELAQNKINVLVATTVVEVGVNVPNATIMVIENADRFGLSQLHQLRGRVGRGAHKSYCILVTDVSSEVCEKRMKVMASTNDGFVISEMDLDIRGTGEFFGTRQHGLPTMMIANLYTDLDILKSAQNEAKKIIEADSELESDENIFLEHEVMRFLKKAGGIFAL